MWKTSKAIKSANSSVGANNNNRDYVLLVSHGNMVKYCYVRNLSAGDSWTRRKRLA